MWWLEKCVVGGGEEGDALIHDSTATATTVDGQLREQQKDDDDRYGLSVYWEAEKTWKTKKKKAVVVVTVGVCVLLISNWSLEWTSTYRRVEWERERWGGKRQLVCVCVLVQQEASHRGLHWPGREQRNK